MKRSLALLLAVLMIFGTASFVHAEEELKPGIGINKEAKFELDGKEKPLRFYKAFVEFEEEGKKVVYEKNILALADFALFAKGTEINFTFDVDLEKKTLTFTTGKDYEGKEAPKINADQIPVANQFGIIRDGKEIPGKIEVITVGDVPFMRTSQVAICLGNFRYMSKEKGNINQIYTDKTDLPDFNIEEFKKNLSKKKFTVVHRWAPDCYYCNLLDPELEKVVEMLKDNEDFQYFGLVNSLAGIPGNYTQKDLSEYVKSEYVRSLEYNDRGDFEKYYKDNINAEDNINYYPEIFIFDSQGKLLGKFQEAADENYNEYLKKTGKTDDDITDDEWLMNFKHSIYYLINKAANKEVLVDENYKVEEKSAEKPEEPQKETLTAEKSMQSFKLNGKDVEIGSYLIDGSNYYKIRDLAQILTDTSVKFNIEWDAENKMMVINKGEAYLKSDSDLKAFPEGKQKGVFATQTVKFDGKDVELKTAFINDNNYVKLRDLAEYIGYKVDFDSQSKTILVNTEEELEVSQDEETPEETNACEEAGCNP